MTLMDSFGTRPLLIALPPLTVAVAIMLAVAVAAQSAPRPKADPEALRQREQELELLRSVLESRLESFNGEFSRKGETLTDSVRNSATSLREEVSTHLAEFRRFTETVPGASPACASRKTTVRAVATVSASSGVNWCASSV